MKYLSKNGTSVSSLRAHFMGIMLVLALMISPAAFASGPNAVNLGTAGDFVILAKTGISATGVMAITGDIGVSPADATYITGFDLIMDPSGTFSTSAAVVGNVYAADYTDPTPTKMTTAISDLGTAYTDAAGRTTPDYSELYTGDLTGQTLNPGLYNWSTGVLVSEGGVTISGTENDVWIFQIAQDLVLAEGAIITLSGGAQASNIFWQVAGQVTLGTTADFKGIILSQTLVEMRTGATLNGRALAQTAVTLDANTVTQPQSETAIGETFAPQEFVLSQNYPNPFNPVTMIHYQLPVAGHVTLSVHNVLGTEVTQLVDQEQYAGQYQTAWNAGEYASGIYFYRLQAGPFVSIKKMVFIK